MENKSKLNTRSICRALISATAVDGYDFECVAVPFENGQIRYSWENDEYFKQVLLVSRENIDTSRLDAGIPLFDNHPEMDDISVLTTYGITVGYSFDERGLICRCKFGARADEALRADVANGVIKGVSIEGSVLSYSITRKAGEIPVYSASLWTPESLSFMPVQQDVLAQIEVKRAIQSQIEGKEEVSVFKSLTNKF